MLEFAVLGLLLESPMHGYELRKRLTGLLGCFPRILLRFAVPDAAPHAGRRFDRRGRRHPPGRQVRRPAGSTS